MLAGIALLADLDIYAIVDNGWPPVVGQRPKRRYVGLHEDMITVNYRHNIMKTFEETRYGC